MRGLYCWPLLPRKLTSDFPSCEEVFLIPTMSIIPSIPSNDSNHQQTISILCLCTASAQVRAAEGSASRLDSSYCRGLQRSLVIQSPVGDLWISDCCWWRHDEAWILWSALFRTYSSGCSGVGTQVNEIFWLAHWKTRRDQELHGTSTLVPECLWTVRRFESQMSQERCLLSSAGGCLRQFSFASLHLVALSTGCNQRAQRQFPNVSSILGREPRRTYGIHSAQIKLWSNFRDRQQHLMHVYGNGRGWVSAL